MTFTKLITCAAMAIALCACTNKKETSTTTDIQSAVVTPIADNAEPRLMPRALFPAASDSLVAALGLADGVPSSVCAVLVETDGNQHHRAEYGDRLENGLVLRLHVAAAEQIDADGEH